MNSQTRRSSRSVRSKPASAWRLDPAVQPHDAIRQALLARIGSEWKVGDRLPSIKDLAREMAVSPNRVQQAVTELVHEGVLFSRRRLGMHVLELPTSARTGSRRAADKPLTGKTVGMVVFSDVVPPFVQRMMTGFRQAITQAGGEIGDVITVNADGSEPAGLRRHWGLALFNPWGTFNLPARHRNVTMISTADHLHPQLIARYDRIGVDQDQGGMLAGQLLREAGCKRACFFGRRLATGDHRFDVTSSARLHGFEHAWGDRLHASDLLYVPGYSINSGALAFQDYLQLSPRPDAVFAASDELAVGFMAAATATSMQAGRDYQIVGFDSQDDRLLTDGRKLTTIQIPALQMGHVAAQMMLQRRNDPSGMVRHVALPCSVAAGQTVRAARRG